MSDFFNLINDYSTLDRFFEEILPPLGPQEVYFFSLSARNKYLSPEEREVLCLGRTEMFERRILREKNYEKFLRLLKKFECNPRAYTSKNDSTIPAKAITCYVNINPSNMLKAYIEFSKVAQEYLMELSLSAMKGNDFSNISERISKFDRLFMNFIQKSKGRRHWMDVDFDVQKGDKVLGLFIDDLKSHNVRFEVLDTHSGYHVLMDKTTMNYNFTKTIEALNGMVKEGEEVSYNKHDMIPLPGTLQGGHPVRIITEAYL